MWLYVQRECVCVCVCACMPGIKWIVCNMLDYRQQLNIRLHNEIIYFNFSLFIPFWNWIRLTERFSSDIEFEAPERNSPRLSVLRFLFLLCTQGLDTLLDACGNKLRLRLRFGFRFAIILAYEYSPIVAHNEQTFYLSSNGCVCVGVGMRAYSCANLHVDANKK